MKRKLALLGVAWSFAALAQPIPDVKEIDLANPPEHLKKSALFEWLAANGLKAFPQDVDNLVDELGWADISPARSLVPRGRSAQRRQTDEKFARVVIASHSSDKLSATDKFPARPGIGFEDTAALPGTDWEGRLFFGVALRNGKGEALSWNRKNYEFDYFVFSGLGTRGAPAKGPVKIYETTNREDCTGCHQNLAPIWTVPPWSEVMNHDPQETGKRKPLARFAQDPTLYRKDGVLLTPEATPAENNGALAIDTSSSTGNRLVQAVRAIKEACDTDLHCRRYIFAGAMANLGQSKYLRKAVVQKSSTGNDINDLDFIFLPLAPLQLLMNTAPTNLNQLPAVLKGFQELLEPLWPRHGFAFTAHILADPTGVVQGQTTQQQSAPETPRTPLGPIPKTLAAAYLYDVSFETFGLRVQDGLKLQKRSLAERMKPLNLEGNVPRPLKKLLENWPPQREDILEFYKIADAPALEVVADEAPQPGIAAEKAIPTFVKNCSGCHKDKDEKIAPYIAFHDAKELLDYERKSQREVTNRLTLRDMPPARVKNRPTEQEYAAMAAFFGGANAVVRAQGPVQVSHLGVRLQRTKGIRRSYILPSSVSIIREGVTEDCGGTVSDGKASRLSSLRAALGSDGKVYLATENFPHALPGNVVEITAAPSPQYDRCYVYGISRNGRLLTLGLDPKRKVLGTIPMHRRDEKNTTALMHVAASPTAVFATGRDGSLYRVHIGSRWTHYRLEKLPVDGATDGKWLKVALRTETQGERVIAATVGGSQSLLGPRLGGAETPRLSVDNTLDGDDTDSAFAPNLLDRGAALAVPWGGT